MISHHVELREPGLVTKLLTPFPETFFERLSHMLDVCCKSGHLRFEYVIFDVGFQVAILAELAA